MLQDYSPNLLLFTLRQKLAQATSSGFFTTRMAHVSQPYAYSLEYTHSRIATYLQSSPSLLKERPNCGKPPWGLSKSSVLVFLQPHGAKQAYWMGRLDFFILLCKSCQKV